MKIAFLEKQSGKLSVFNCKSDLLKIINVSSQTLRNWQKKENQKEIDSGFVIFDIEFIKASKNIRKHSNFK